MIKNVIVAGVVALVVSFAVGMVGGDQSSPVTDLGRGSRFPNGISADSTLPSAGQIRSSTLTVTGASTLTGAVTASGDMTVGGGTLDVTHTNAATSTMIAGCWQFYATSTDTALNYTASTTPGIMYSSYGSCPNL